MVDPPADRSAAMTATEATIYEVQVRGHLDAHWATRWGDLAMTHLDDGTSILTGPVLDQAQLHGILARLRDIGATLIAVRAIDPPVDPARRGTAGDVTNRIT